MGVLRGSGRGPHLDLRRHVPALQLDLHLRRRLQGRAHRGRRPSWCRAAAPTAPTSSTTTTCAPPRRPPTRLTDEQWQFRARRPQGRVPAHPGRRHAHHPARRRRLHLPEPPRLRRRRRAARCTRPPMAAGERHMDWKPEVCWQLPLRRRSSTDDHGHVTSHAARVEAARLGRGRRRVPLVVHRDARRLRRPHDRCYVALPDEIVEPWSEPVAYELLVAQLGRAGAAPRCCPIPRCAVRRRQRRPPSRSGPESDPRQRLSSALDAAAVLLGAGSACGSGVAGA